MYEQLDLFSYVNLPKTEIPYLLTPGQEIYIVDKADVEKIIVDGERTWICGNIRYYRIRKECGTYDVTNNDEIGERAFLDYEDARNKAYEYLRSHTDIILAEDINPLNIVAYSYVSKCDNRTMTAFYCDLGEDMHYIKEFMTFTIFARERIRLRNLWNSRNLSMRIHRGFKDMCHISRICTNARSRLIGFMRSVGIHMRWDKDEL